MKAPTILLTRPQEASERFAAHFTVPVIISPLLQIMPNGQQVPEQYSGSVIFTSAHAVALAGNGRQRQAFCVGEHTTKAANKAGWQVITTAPDADRLVAQMVTPTEVIHICGQHHRGHIAERLTKKGFDAKRLIMYDQLPLSLTDEARDLLTSPLIAPVFSPRTAEILADQGADFRLTHFIALSPAVAEPLSGLKSAGLTVLSEPTGKLMIKSIEKLIGKGLA